MIDRRTLARLAAGLALGLAGFAHAALEPCDKNHYILDLACAVEWAPVNEGLADLDVRVVAVDPTKKSTLYAGGTSGVFKSVLGAAWKRAGTLPGSGFPGTVNVSTPSNHKVDSAVAHIVVDPAHPNTVYAATIPVNGCVWTQRRLYTSSDGGETWSDRQSPNINGCDAVHALVLAPSTPGTLFLANGEAGDSPSPAIRSTDRAASWSSMGYLALQSLAVDPFDDRVVYGGTSSYFNEWTSLPNGVLKSRDGGVTWSATGLKGQGVAALAMDPLDSRIVFGATGLFGIRAATFEGLYRSADGGVTWESRITGLEHLVHGAFPVTAIAIDPENTQRIYLAMAGGGAWRSVDGGTTWTPFNDGLSSAQVRSLALVPGKPNRLYAGTDRGVFAVYDVTPVLFVDAPKRCVGAPWTVKLARGKPGAFVRLYGSFIDHPWVANRRNDPWEGGGFITDARGGFSTSGIFTEAGIHVFRVEVGGALSNSASVEVHTCPP